MKKINIVFVALFVGALFTISSCSKEQSALNKLAGTWTYKSVVHKGTGTPVNGNAGLTKLHFSVCADFNTRCSGYLVQNGTQGNFQYDLNKAGTQANVYNDNGGTDTYIISKLDNNNLVYTYDYPIYGVLEFTLTK